MFSESGYAGVGFSLGCGVNVDVARTRLPGSLDQYFWGGAAATAVWIDPKEQLSVVFKTERFTSCCQPEGKGRALKLQDDARESIYAKPPKLESDGGGLVSMAHDYLRFCRMS